MWLHYKILVFPWFWKSIGKLTRIHFSDRAASKLVMLDPKEFTSFPHCLFSSSAPRHYHVDCTLKLDVTKAFFSNLDQVRAARFGISFLDCSKLTVEFRIFPGCSNITIDSPAGVVCCCWMHHSFYCGFPECFSWLNFRESPSLLKTINRPAIFPSKFIQLRESKSMRASSSLFTIAMGKISSKISFFADNWVHQKSCATRTITIALTNNTIDPCSQDNPTATPGHKLLMVFDFLGFQRQTSHQRYLFFISCSFLLHKQCYTKLFVYLLAALFVF